MKKLLLFLIVALLSIATTMAQGVSIYSFATSTETYTPITGGTMLKDGTTSMDSWASTAQTIPAFTLNEIAYTTAYVTSNGIVTLGGTAPSSSTTTGISTTTGSGITLCPFSADLDRGTTTASTEIRWETIGDEIIFQWQQVKRYGQTESFDMQARLNTNDGVIKFVYQLNSGPGSGTSYQPQVGIRTSTTDYNNRLVASGTEDWATSLAGTANNNTCRFTSASPAKGFTSGLTFTFTPPSCISPSGLTVSAITTTTATISWTAPSTVPANGYQYEVRTTGAAGSGPTGLVVSGTTVVGDVDDNITGLTESTEYAFYVRGICAVGDTSAWAGPKTFATSCYAFSTLPYTENFDGTWIGTPPAPTCWKVVNADADGYTWRQGNNYITPTHSTPNAAIGMGNNNDYLITPQFALTANSVDIRWWDKVENATRNNTYDVLLSTTTSDIASFTTNLGTFDCTNTDWVEHILTLTGYSGQSIYIAFHQTYSAATNYGFGIDDFSMEVTPTCFVPTALTASNITSASADLGWTTGGATLWNIEYGAAGFTQGTGTVIHNVSNPYTLNGLTAITAYDFYVQDSCGVGDVSMWAGPYSFTTACEAISSLPWTENFDAVSIPSFPVCWFKENGDWITTNNANSTYDADALSGTQFLRESYSATNEYIWTPGFALTSGESYDFSFFWAGDNNSGWTGDVFYNTNQISTGATQLGISFVESGTITNKTYVKVVNSFVPSSTGVYYFAIRINATTSPWYISFDDFRLELSPTCPAPTGLTASNITSASADLGWTTGGAAQWNIEYGAAGFTQGTGTVIHNVSNPYTLNGLTFTTAYDFYVQDSCGVGDLSTWAGPYTFTTACANITSYPYTQSFDATLDPCWSAYEASTGSSRHWATTTADATYGVSGPQAGTHFAYLYVYFAETTYNPYYLETGTFEFDAVPKQISYYYYLGNSGYTITPVPLTLQISTDNGANWIDLYEHTTANSTFSTNGDLTGWYQNTVDLAAYINETVIFRFASNSNYSSGRCNQGIDEVVIREIMSASITPAFADYDLTTPANVETTVTWNEATTITGIVDNQGTPYTLVETTDYTVSGNDLTILDSYLANVLTTVGNDVDLTLSFDVGADAVFAITAIETLAGPVTIAHWDFEDATKRDLITDSTTFMTTPYTADDGIAANIDIAPISITTGSKFAGWAAGSGGTGSWAANASQWTDGMDAKYWVVTISTTGYEDLLLSSKQRGSNTGPRDFKVQYSTDGTIWTDVIGSEITVAGNFTSGVLNDIALPAECNNQASLMLRWIMTSNVSVNAGTTAAAGTNRFDDILITGVEASIVDVNGVINPDSTQYDLTTPADVVATITWNDATTINSIVDNQGTPHTLVANTDYTVSGNDLTIMDSYLANVLTTAGNVINLKVTFDLGIDSLVITAIESPAAPVTIAHWNFEDETKRDLITDSATFMTSPYTADNGIAANIDIAPISITTGTMFTAWAAGSGGTGSWAANTSQWTDGMDAKYWVVTISTTGYEDLLLSSKQRGSNTGPRDFKVQYSTDGTIWTDVIGSEITVAGNFTSGVLNDIALPVECNNQASLMLRWIMTSNVSVNAGTTAAAGTNRIDDILIMGVEVNVPVLEFASDVKVYPNPSNGQFVIESQDNWTMMVFDIAGRMIASDNLYVGSNDINLLGKPSGFYLIKLVNAKQTQTIRIVIE